MLPKEEQRVLQIIPIPQKGKEGEALAQVQGFILYLRRPEEYSGLTTEAESEEYFDTFDKEVLTLVKKGYSEKGREVERRYKKVLYIDDINTVVEYILGKERRSVTFHLCSPLGKLQERDEVSFQEEPKVPSFTMDIYLCSRNVEDSINFWQDEDASLEDLQKKATEAATKAEETCVSPWLTHLRESYPFLDRYLRNVSQE